MERMYGTARKPIAGADQTQYSDWDNQSRQSRHSNRSN